MKVVDVSEVDGFILFLLSGPITPDKTGVVAVQTLSSETVGHSPLHSRHCTPSIIDNSSSYNFST